MNLIGHLYARLECGTLCWKFPRKSIGRNDSESHWIFPFATFRQNTWAVDLTVSISSSKLQVFSPLA